MPTIRPMEERDVPAIHELSIATFQDLEERFHEEPHDPPPLHTAAPRLLHLLTTDPRGSWVAEEDGAVVGCALGILREGIWGLSLLVVHPLAQSRGLGRELLARAHDYGAGARGRMILASRDPRALRAYAALGLDLHPAARAVGRPRDMEPPDGVRPLRDGDAEWIAEVGRAVRGASHAGDLHVITGTAVGVPGRGYAVWRDASLKVLAARDEEAARLLLRAHLAAAGGVKATVEWLTSAQQWAIRECLAAGLELDTAHGAVLLAGELGPLRPYLPSGAYL